MADRLIQSQLIRAQESENTLVLRHELAVLRRKYFLLLKSNQLNKDLVNDSKDDEIHDTNYLQSTKLNGDDNCNELDHDQNNILLKVS